MTYSWKKSLRNASHYQIIVCSKCIMALLKPMIQTNCFCKGRLANNTLILAAGAMFFYLWLFSGIELKKMMHQNICGLRRKEEIVSISVWLFSQV